MIFVSCGSLAFQTMSVHPRHEVRHRLITCLQEFPSQISQPSFEAFTSTRQIQHEQENGTSVTVQHIFNFVLILWGLSTTSHSGQLILECASLYILVTVKSIPFIVDKTS